MEKIGEPQKIRRQQTTMKKLIKRLETYQTWYSLSIYLDKNYIRDEFIPFLMIIEKDPRMNRGKLKNPRAIISNALRKIISAYKRAEQKKILDKEVTESETSASQNQ